MFNVKGMLMLKMAKVYSFLIGILLVSCCCIVNAKPGYMRYLDNNQPTNLRIEDLMERMTLEEKIGQMAMIELSVASLEVVNKYYIGGVFSGPGSVPGKEASAQTWGTMVNNLQQGARTTRLMTPMIYGIDAVHGHNNVYKATIFPHNIGLGATRDPKLVKKIGVATALEVRATGIHYTFAPSLAVCRDPRWGRCYESYSEDPNVVRAMTEIIPGLQGDIPANFRKGVPYVNGTWESTKIAACAKHYVGDGGTTPGINENNTVSNSHLLRTIHMPAFIDSIIKGVSSIMISSSSLNGISMHANRDLITDYLKDTLHFRGFVISDWQGIDNIPPPPHANYTYSILTSINAGIDMIMIPYNYKEFLNELTFLVKNDFIPMSRIDDAVKRILRVKFTMSLFEDMTMTDLSLVEYLGHQSHRELAREAVRKSLVLLKNGKEGDKPLLPLLGPAPRILVAGSHADNIGYLCGGWTIEHQGLGGNITVGTTILAAIKNTTDQATEVIFKENPDAAFVKSNNFSYAIVVVGELPYAGTYGNSLDLTIPEPGPSVIQNVCGSLTCVVILITGRPVLIQPYLHQIDALVAAWLPGTEGLGVTDVLFGHYGFTGKLPYTWFKSVNQLPMNVGDRHYQPLFPFGYGLTTTSQAPTVPQFYRNISTT